LTTIITSKCDHCGEHATQALTSVEIDRGDLGPPHTWSTITLRIPIEGPDDDDEEEIEEEELVACSPTCLRRLMERHGLTEQPLEVRMRMALEYRRRRARRNPTRVRPRDILGSGVVLEGKPKPPTQ